MYEYEVEQHVATADEIASIANDRARGGWRLVMLHDPRPNAGAAGSGVTFVFERDVDPIYNAFVEDQLPETLQGRD